MSTHDPKKIIEILRNHLATADMPLAFLFGAGTSSSIKIEKQNSNGEEVEYEPIIPSIELLTKFQNIVTLCKEAPRRLCIGLLSGGPVGASEDLVLGRGQDMAKLNRLTVPHIQNNWG